MRNWRRNRRNGNAPSGNCVLRSGRLRIERGAKRNYVLLSVALAVFLAAAVLLAMQAQHEKVEAHTQQQRAEALATQSNILSNRATAAERTAQAALKDLEAASARGDEAEKLRDEAAQARQQAEASEQKPVKLEQTKSSLSDQASQTIETQNKQIAALRAQLNETQKALPAAPAARLTAEPSSIVLGQSATLRWQVSGQTHNEAGTAIHRSGPGQRKQIRHTAGLPEFVHRLYAPGRRTRRNQHLIRHRSRHPSGGRPSARPSVPTSGTHSRRAARVAGPPAPRPWL